MSDVAGAAFMVSGLMLLAGAMLAERDRRRSLISVSPWWAPMYAFSGLGALGLAIAEFFSNDVMNLAGTVLVAIGGVGTFVVAVRNRRRQRRL